MVLLLSSILLFLLSRWLQMVRVGSQFTMKEARIVLSCWLGDRSLSQLITHTKLTKKGKDL
jgi:hypothetical protein